MTAADHVAVLHAAAGYLHEFGMNRTPTADGEPSLGRIICRAHALARVPHSGDRCSQLQTEIANAGNADTLADLVRPGWNTRAIVELLNRHADQIEASALAVTR